jgi:hypothetical protein
MAVGEEHRRDVNRLPGCALDGKPAAVDRRTDLVDNDATTGSGQSTIVSRLRTVDC